MLRGFVLMADDRRKSPRCALPTLLVLQVPVSAEVLRSQPAYQQGSAKSNVGCGPFE